MRASHLVLCVIGTLAASATVAHAYPQYQLSKEQTCASCHISPVGGGLLDDNGELTAEDESQWGGNPAFLHGKVELPEWLRVGGDLRGAAGTATRGGGLGPAGFPMQTELYAHAGTETISAYVIGGVTLKGESVMPFSREHWLLWQQGDGDGLYVRAGRLMPVQGLRQPEHIYYSRRFGGTPLFSEVYGANVGYIKPDLEAHLTAFVHDPLIDSIEDGDGAVAYVEKRFGGGTKSVGVLDRFTTSDTDTKMHVGVTGKLWMAEKKLLFGTELQLVRQNFKSAAETRFQTVGNLYATYFVKPGLFVDLGLGHYDEDISIAKLDRDAIDLNVHFFALSHLELLLTNRVQMIAFGSGGATSGYTLLQVHYRI